MSVQNVIVIHVAKSLTHSDLCSPFFKFYRLGEMAAFASSSMVEMCERLNFLE